jgi:hypothetical protein
MGEVSRIEHVQFIEKPKNISFAVEQDAISLVPRSLSQWRRSPILEIWECELKEIQWYLYISPCSLSLSLPPLSLTLFFLGHSFTIFVRAWRQAAANDEPYARYRTQQNDRLISHSHAQNEHRTANKACCTTQCHCLATAYDRFHFDT